MPCTSLLLPCIVIGTRQDCRPHHNRACQLRFPQAAWNLLFLGIVLYVGYSLTSNKLRWRNQSEGEPAQPNDYGSPSASQHWIPARGLAPAVGA